MRWLRWLRQVVGWVVGFIPVTYHVLVPAFFAAVVAALLWWSIIGCEGLRRVGLLLQVLGFGLVAMGLIQVVRLFDEHSPRRRLHDHLRRFPRPYGRTQVIQGAHFDARSSFSGGRLLSTPDPDSTLEHRLASLERNFLNLHREVGETQDLIAHNKREAEEAIAAVSERVGEVERGLRGLLGRALAGGVQREWAGLWFFVLGIVLSTATPEIARWLGETSCP